MKGFESGKDKIKKICDALKKETLDPAQKEAEELVRQAHLRAEEIVREGERKVEKMVREAEKGVEERKRVFEATLAQACRQSLEVLREKIEHQFFNTALAGLLTKPLQEAKVVAKMVEAVVGALEKEGTEADLSVAIASAISPKEVAELLGKRVVDRLKEKAVVLSAIGGGVQIRFVDKNLMIDLSEEALKELVAGFTRKDFRELIFGQ